MEVNALSLGEGGARWRRAGTFSVEEMRAAICRMYGQERKPALVSAMMKAADTNEDGEYLLKAEVTKYGVPF